MNNRSNTGITCDGFFGTASLVLAVAFSLLSCDQQQEIKAGKAETEVIRPVKLMTVASGDDALNRSLPGRVRAFNRVELAFQVGGTLVQLPVQEGQSVKKGDLLARLDSRDFEVALRNAESRVQRAKALLRLSTVEYERLERVRKADPGAVALSHLDRAMERKEMAHADLLTAEAALDTAKLQLSYTYLKAPFPGIVSSRSVDNFQEVQAKQTIFSMDDFTMVEVLVEVPESLMAPIRSPGTYLVTAEFAPAPGKRYPLTLKEYSIRGDPKTLTYQVTFQMPQPEEKINILPGMTANVVAEPKERSALPIVIPAVAVFSEGGIPHVWVVNSEDMTAQLRKVKTGALTGADGIEIIEGLQRGETIAVSAVTHLREGTKVRKFES
jgi:membrane fusion protein, multidrug efflux system